VCAGDFLQDVVCFCGPDEGFGILVVTVDVVSDGPDELFQILEDAMPDSIGSQVAEEALDPIQP
jgi:hypothetical protein